MEKSYFTNGVCLKHYQYVDEEQFRFSKALRVSYQFRCPRGVMDNTEDSGSSAGGSIPSEGAILLF